jgi:SET domain-containing protein
MNYKPLPFCVTIDKSLIHGLGLFATEDIPADIKLGITHYFIRSDLDVYAEGSSSSGGYQNVRVHEAYKEIRRTPIGGFYNHSEDPNCYSLITSDHAELVTLRDIEVGEELTTFYNIAPL